MLLFGQVHQLSLVDLEGAPVVVVKRRDHLRLLLQLSQADLLVVRELLSVLLKHHLLDGRLAGREPYFGFGFSGPLLLLLVVDYGLWLRHEIDFLGRQLVQLIVLSLLYLVSD